MALAGLCRRRIATIESEAIFELFLMAYAASNAKVKQGQNQQQRKGNPLFIYDVLNHFLLANGRTAFVGRKPSANCW